MIPLHGLAFFFNKVMPRHGFIEIDCFALAAPVFMLAPWLSRVWGQGASWLLFSLVFLSFPGPFKALVSYKPVLMAVAWL